MEVSLLLNQSRDAVIIPESGADAQGEAAEKYALPHEKYTVTAQNTATLSIIAHLPGKRKAQKMRIS
jgi:hypothetical protein